MLPVVISGVSEMLEVNANDVIRSIHGIIDMWPKYRNGVPVIEGDELDFFSNTIYKEVRRIAFSDGCYIVSNCGGSANINVIGEYGTPIEEAVASRC